MKSNKNEQKINLQFYSDNVMKNNRQIKRNQLIPDSWICVALIFYYHTYWALIHLHKQ